LLVEVSMIVKWLVSALILIVVILICRILGVAATRF